MFKTYDQKAIFFGREGKERVFSQWIVIDLFYQFVFIFSTAGALVVVTV